MPLAARGVKPLAHKPKVAAKPRHNARALVGQGEVKKVDRRVVAEPPFVVYAHVKRFRKTGQNVHYVVVAEGKRRLI